ncbi:MAG: tetratricopeptide repeat protein [Elusimicrobia bacterium]|nr:tetratricopeptide repeat protein [Elusimicrobiota bacterium]
MGRRAILIGALALSCGCKTPPRQCPAGGSGSEAVSAILAQAKQADYDGKYELALDITAQVTRFRGDPEEAKAWAIRGSTFYLMGNKGRAKDAWKRAFEIDPCMTEIPELIKKLDSEKR